MGAWRRLHTRAGGGAFVNCISATRRTEPRGWVLSVPLLDRVWTRSIGRRLRRGMLRRLGGRHDTRARFALFEGDKGKLLPPQFLSLYIVIAWKNSRRRSCVSLRILVVQKKPRAQLRSCKHSKFLRQLQQSCRVPGLRTRVPQRRRIAANNPTKLTHDDARRPPHVQRDEAAHASRSA